MNRYEDNTSPQPSSAALLDNFKTPEANGNLGSNGTNLVISSSAFPTPPSDNDESRDSIGSYSNHKYHEYLKANQTPVLDASSYQYYERQNNFNQLMGNSEHYVAEISNTSDSDILSSISADKVAEAALSSSRFKRRSRTTFTKHQLDILEATFQKTHYPDVSVVDRLSSVLNLGTERISIWFQNRRARHKKERKQQAEQAKAANLGNKTSAQFNNEAWKQQMVANAANKFAIEKLTAPTAPTYSRIAPYSPENIYQTAPYAAAYTTPTTVAEGTQHNEITPIKASFDNNTVFALQSGTYNYNLINDPRNYNQNLYYQPNYVPSYYQYQTNTNA